MKSTGDVTSWAILLIASASLVSMICLYLVDNIVRGTLDNYGLQFSYDWATPYWRLVQIGFTLGWINIATAFIVQANTIRLKRKAEQPADAIEEAWKAAKSTETEKAPKENPEEKTETEPAKPSEGAPQSAPEPEAQEKKEEPQPPEKKPEQEPQLQETKPDEIPSLASLY